jgi:hypothetical protein
MPYTSGVSCLLLKIQHSGWPPIEVLGLALKALICVPTWLRQHWGFNLLCVAGELTQGLVQALYL